MMEGLSTAQVGMALRTALFGKEISKIKEGEDEYKIQLRYADAQRNNVTDLMSMRMTYMDMNTMQIKSIPLSTVAAVDYTSSTGAVKRKNVRRTIQLQSSVNDPTQVAPINQALAAQIETFKSLERIPSLSLIHISEPTRPY